MRPDVEQRRHRLDALARPDASAPARVAHVAPTAASRAPPCRGVDGFAPRASSFSLMWKSGRSAFSRSHSSFFESAGALRATRCSARAATGSKIAERRRSAREPVGGHREASDQCGKHALNYNARVESPARKSLPSYTRYGQSHAQSRIAVSGVALEAGALVAGRQEPTTRRAAEVRAVGREGRPARRVRRVAGEAALLAVAGDAGADVALGRPANGWSGAGWRSTAPPASRAHPGRVELLEPGPGAERVVRAPPGQPALGIGGDPRAAGGSRRRTTGAVAGRAVGRVPARVDHMQRDVVGRVDVGRPDHAAVAVDAVVALVAGQAVALVAPGLARGRVRKVGPWASMPRKRARRHQRPRAARRHRRRRWPASSSAARPAPSGGRRSSARSPACRRDSRGRSPSSAGRRASPAPAPCRRWRGRARRRCRASACSWWLNFRFGRASTTRGGSARRRRRRHPAVAGRRRRGRRRSARRPARARTALAGWVAIDLVAAAAGGLARDQVVGGRRRRQRRHVAALAGRAQPRVLARDRTRSGSSPPGR